MELQPSLVSIPIGFGFTDKTVIELSSLNRMPALFPKSQLEASPCEKQLMEMNINKNNTLNFIEKGLAAKGMQLSQKRKMSPDNSSVFQMNLKPIIGSRQILAIMLTIPATLISFEEIN